MDWTPRVEKALMERSYLELVVTSEPSLYHLKDKGWLPLFGAQMATENGEPTLTMDGVKENGAT